MTTTFENKYDVIEKIGEGSFSEVLKVEDRATKLHYAAKKLKKRFKNIHDVLHCAEIIATQKLCRHPNVLYMLEYIYDSFGGKVVFIFELMDMSMYEYMKLKKRLSENKVKLYLYQMLKGLEHLHNNGLFHRDIKPENILVKLPAVNQDTAVFEGELVKLADLGSIRGIYSQPPYTEYISTRWYRSPECLLTVGNYGCKMDVWAVGCVFYEMLTMKPLFPGVNEIDQLSKIHTLLGTPSNRLLCKFKKRSKNFENFPHNPGSGLGPLLCNITEDSQNLLKLMLQYDPEARSNVKRLLENKYFTTLRNDDLFRKYENSEVKTRLLKKDNGDQNYLQYIGSSNNWKNSKFQNTLHGYVIPTKMKPSSHTQPPQQQNTIKEQKSFTKEHAATTGNLRKEYSFTSHAKSKHRDHANPLPPPPHLSQHRSNQQQQNDRYGNNNRIHVLPLTEQMLLGQHYSGIALGGGAGYTYGYGAPGAQGARVHMGEGAGTGDRPLKRPVQGVMYSRTTVHLPTSPHHRLQRPTPSTNMQYHHRFNTISRMIKQKPLVKNNADQRTHHNRPIVAEQRDRSRNQRNRYNQCILRGGGSKGSKDSKTKAKSNNSSKSRISGKGLGVTLGKSDKYKYKNECRYSRHRSKSRQRLAVDGKSLRKQQRQQEFGVMKSAGSPVRIGGSVRNVMRCEVDIQPAHAYDRVGGNRNLRKRAASKSPQATPSKHLGATHNYRTSSNSFSSGGTVVSRWSDLKRQSSECHKQLDVAPLPVCRMNIGQSTMYKGYQVLPSVGAAAVGALRRGVAGGNMFRKTTSNLPQLIKKPLPPQHSHPYSNSAGKREFQSRTFVLPKRPQGRNKLDTIVELKGKGSRKFK